MQLPDTHTTLQICLFCQLCTLRKVRSQLTFHSLVMADVQDKSRTFTQGTLHTAALCVLASTGATHKVDSVGPGEAFTS